MDMQETYEQTSLRRIAEALEDISAVLRGILHQRIGEGYPVGDVQELMNKILERSAK